MPPGDVGRQDVGDRILAIEEHIVRDYPCPSARFKEALPRGEFEKWIKSQCEFSKSTAQRYMKAAAAFKLKSVTMTDLQEADLSEELSDIVPVSLYSCDFRRIELIPATKLGFLQSDSQQVRMRILANSYRLYTAPCLVGG
jgi:hypothetical protein